MCFALYTSPFRRHSLSRGMFIQIYQFVDDCPDTKENNLIFAYFP